MISKIIFRRDVIFLRRLERANKDEMLSWQLPNLYYPICAIILSLLSFLIFKDSSKRTTIAFVNLLINGSVPMMALNRLSTLGVNIFKFDREKEKKKSKYDTYNLRLRIHYYSYALILAIAVLYIFQVTNNPFDWSWWFCLQIPLSIFCVYEALEISKYAYLLQERLIDSTFDQEIIIDMEEKGHGANWPKES